MLGDTILRVLVLGKQHIVLYCVALSYQTVQKIEGLAPECFKQCVLMPEAYSTFDTLPFVLVRWKFLRIVVLIGLDFLLSTWPLKSERKQLVNPTLALTI